MNYSHEAIYLAYPNAVTIDDGAGVFDSNGNKIQIEPEKVLVFEEEVAKTKKNAEIEYLRKNAYTTEADPIFFKAQRNEATISEWIDKVEEIRNRFPYQE